MRDLSSLTREPTCAPCIVSVELNHWITREVPTDGVPGNFKEKGKASTESTWGWGDLSDEQVWVGLAGSWTVSVQQCSWYLHAGILLRG